MKEEALLLGPHRSLVGVLTTPPDAAATVVNRLCVVMLNAGLIHRVGPHRLHVKLARALAARGISSLRADLSGIGDSLPRPDHLPASLLASREPSELLDSLAALGFERFVLFGICAGAKHALLSAIDDERACGLVLVNQESTSEDPAAIAARASSLIYVQRSSRNRRAWINLVTGRTHYRRLVSNLARELWRRVRRGHRRESSLGGQFRAELEPALRHPRRLLLVFSDRLAECIGLLRPELAALEGDDRVQISLYRDTDHLFTPLDAQARLIEDVCRWVGSLDAASAAGNKESAAA